MRIKPALRADLYRRNPLNRNVAGNTFSSSGEPTDLPESLTIDEYEGDIGMYLVQLKAPMTTTWWRGLQAAGDVVAYYPENTYLVRAAKSVPTIASSRV